MGVFDTAEKLMNESVNKGSLGTLTVYDHTQFTITANKYDDLLKWYKAITSEGVMPVNDLIEIGRGCGVVDFTSTGGKGVHRGYVMHREGKVIECFCGCQDFFFRCWYPLIRYGLARRYVPSTYNQAQPFNKRFGGKIVRDKNTGRPIVEFRRFNGKPTDITNHLQKMAVCKHIHTAIVKFC